MNDNTQNTQNTQADFFDLHTPGLGYLNRARTVTPDQGKPYESVSIAALRGLRDNPSYTYYDTNVVGSDAIAFCKQYKEAINDRESKVLVIFKVGDSFPTSYVVKSGANAGKRNHVIKSRLLRITKATVNGVVVLESNGSTDVDESQPSLDPTSEPSEDNQSAADSSGQPGGQSTADDQQSTTVELDPKDPEFEVKRTRLKKAGYRWDRGQAAWVLWDSTVIAARMPAASERSSLDAAGVYDDIPL